FLMMRSPAMERSLTTIVRAGWRTAAALATANAAYFLKQTGKKCCAACGGGDFVLQRTVAANVTSPCDGRR
ncbi:hypothetical protein, partial [Xanthomonas maliensis]|uniref:hypothetical protein n=1 Tax=Xanthomonas maliensis TaxID=1321368 RepID=UPI001EE3040F